jgi:3',5'-cyclic AMP phosphodiesterase CpdA
MGDALTRREWLRQAAWSAIAVGLAGAGCQVSEGRRLPDESTEPLPAEDYVLVARLAHISDSHLIDEESPARLVFAKGFVPFAYRPYERYSTQLLDGIIRAINRFHASGNTIDCVIHTGDVADNQQFNERRWFRQVVDGESLDPRTGPDDRPPDRRGPVELDPHASFQPEGLYRQGVHGDRPSIPWYDLVGNHDRYALGAFPIVPSLFGSLYAPLPLPSRLGLFLPRFLDPTAGIAHSPITPAHPGPPVGLSLPTQIPPNTDRRYYNRAEFVTITADTLTGPFGHGFAARSPDRTWYSVSPVPGLRLIGLDTCRPVAVVPAGIYSEGALDANQFAFLQNELRAAQDRGELVCVLTHHPSSRLDWTNGSVVSAADLRTTLSRYPCVVAHLVGHMHSHRVSAFDGYVEIQTASTLDFPQEGRIIEIWKRDADVQLRYRVFSHLPENDGSPGGPDCDPVADPLCEMRRIAFELARENPVIPGIVPPHVLLDEGLDTLTDVVGDLGNEIGDLSDELLEAGEGLADAAADHASAAFKGDPAAALRAVSAGSPSDRNGVITLPRK